MNRGGLLGAAFEMDDRFTGYSAAGIVASKLDAGKMLLRIDRPIRRRSARSRRAAPP